jgi:hypothetical protein
MSTDKEQAVPQENPTLYTTLSELVKSEELGEKKRPYCVSIGGKTRYVVSNSPGNAALACCTVETVKQRELLAATIDALHGPQD